MSRETLAGLFGAAGWEVRKCGWEEFEVRSSFAELVIEAEKPTLVHGVVAEAFTNAPQIISLLSAPGSTYHAELYGDDQSLLKEWRSNAT